MSKKESTDTVPSITLDASLPYFRRVVEFVSQQVGYDTEIDAQERGEVIERLDALKKEALAWRMKHPEKCRPTRKDDFT